MIRQTSIDAYYDIQKRKTELVRDIVYKIISCYDGITDREMLESFTNESQKNFQPKVRRHELYVLGKILCIGKRKCTISGKKSMIWVVNDFNI